MEDRTFSRTFETIYDASTSFENWVSALEQLAHVFRAHIASLFFRNLRTMAGNAVAFGSDEQAAQEYFEVWGKRNTFVNRRKIWLPGVVETDQQMVPRRDRLRSDYYNEYMVRFEANRILSLSLITEAGVHQTISLSRKDTIGDFEAADIELGKRLMPHLQRAARITWHIERSNLIQGAAAELLEKNPTGVVLLDHTGCVTFANRALQAMAARADAFVIRHRRLEVLQPGKDVELRRLIAGAIGRDCKIGEPRGGVVRWPRKSGSRDYAVAVGPLCSGTALFGEIAPVAFVLVTDPDASPHLRSVLRQVYGLTAAEAGMAERLILGDTPEQAAEAFSIKTSTARWHVASLFRKTDTRRQSELIRLFLSLPWRDGSRAS